MIEIMAGISCQLVSSLNDFAKENSNPEFALIYDRDSVYAWCNNKIVLLAKNDFPIGIETRSYIEDVPTTYYSDIELAQLTPAAKLNEGISCYGEDDESAYVRVPAVKQTTDSNCWAACMASILSVELGGNYACDDLNSLLPSSSGATILQVKNLFSTHFNISYSTCSRTNSTDSCRKMGNPVPFSKVTSRRDNFCVESSTLSTSNCRPSMVRRVPMVSGSGASGFIDGADSCRVGSGLEVFSAECVCCGISCRWLNRLKVPSK